MLELNGNIFDEPNGTVLYNGSDIGNIRRLDVELAHSSPGRGDITSVNQIRTAIVQLDVIFTNIGSNRSDMMSVPKTKNTILKANI